MRFSLAAISSYSKLSFRAAAIRTRNSLRSFPISSHFRDLHSAKPSGVAVNSKPHLRLLSRQQYRPAYGAALRSYSEFAPDGKFLREIGPISTLGPSRIPFASIKKTTSGSPTKAPTWSQVQSARPRCDGLRSQAGSSDEGTEPLKHPSRRCLLSTVCSAKSPTWLGIPPATRISATATSIRASPKPTKMASG